MVTYRAMLYLENWLKQNNQTLEKNKLLNFRILYTLTYKLHMLE